MTCRLPPDWFRPAPAPATPGPGPLPSEHRRRALPVPARLALAFLALVAAGALVGPHLAPRPYDRLDLAAAYLPPGPGRWLGTDGLGRDLWARTWMGARVSLGIGLGAALLDLGVGTVYGGVAALAGGMLDALLMRLVDVLYGVPFLLVAILCLVALGPGLPSVVVAIALVHWLGMARLVRGQALRLAATEFVLAARGLGVPRWRVLVRHILPGAAGPALVWLSWSVPAAIFAEAFLSYLGLGVQPPLASWGTMIAEATAAFREHPWPLACPAVALSLTMLALYVASDGLRDVLDPRAARRP
jgi:oligopeptide transport system permease protein